MFKCKFMCKKYTEKSEIIFIRPFRIKLFSLCEYITKRHVNTLNNNYYIIWNCTEIKTILREKKLKAT